MADDALHEELLDTLELLLNRPGWMRDALCVEHPTVSFYVELGERTEPVKLVCSRCLCQSERLNDALGHDEGSGVGGGTSPQERKALRRDPRAA